MLRDLAAHMPNARSVTIADASHGMLMQNPAAYSRAVLDFLMAP